MRRDAINGGSAEADAALGERMQILPIVPKLTRRLCIAHRPRALLDGATLRVLEVLAGFRQA